MKIALIGHRGIGKSSLLERLKSYIPESEQFSFLSLDQEIETKTGNKVFDIFLNSGECIFRGIERNIFNEVNLAHENKNLILDIGAGFEGDIPQDWQCVWIKRSIDSSESLFLNRPNLDGSLQMSRERFLAREERYKSLANYEIELLEHVNDICPYEKQFFLKLIGVDTKIHKPSPWYLTVLENRAYPQYLEMIHKLTGCGFELRDDLLSETNMVSLLKDKRSYLVSFRDKSRIENTGHLLDQVQLWDWPLEWGQQEAPILSLHQRKSSVLETLKSLEGVSSKIKLAIPIEDFKELKIAWDWYKEDPQKRIVLPSSQDGRWKWFRLLYSNKMNFGFFKVGEGSSFDQPQLLELLRFVPEYSYWAAILGSPVKHSLTPATHDQYFKSKDGNVLSVDLKESNWEESINFLKDLGLRWAAVTSPLKLKAHETIQNSKQKINSTNTLMYSDNKWCGTNTDIDGIKALKKKMVDDEPAVWGGGGTLDVIREVFPKAHFYSSRTGEPRDGEKPTSPKHIIWAVGKNFNQDGVYPPENWTPESVIDLNYTQDSPGITCAYNYGCQYHSGLDMFLEQARKQQEFWNQYGI